MRHLIEQLRVLMEEPKWHRPDVSRSGPEYGEITRTRRSLKLPAKELHAAVKKAKLGPLSDKHWEKLSNTESWKANKADAHYIAKKYKRDIGRIFRGFKQGTKTPAPIVLHRKGKNPYLIGGNTRLLAASAAKIRPKVLHVRLKK